MTATNPPGSRAALPAPTAPGPQRPPAPRRWPLWLALAGIAGLLLLLGLGLRGDPRTLPSVLVGRPWPAFDLPVLGEPGRRLDAAALAGKPRVVNVWASWCAACREEHPALLALAAELRAQGRADRLLGLNYKDGDAAARAWLAEGGNPYALSLVDADGRLGIELGVYGVPETFVTDAAGRIVHKHVGPLTPQAIREQILPRLADGGGR